MEKLHKMHIIIFVLALVLIGSYFFINHLRIKEIESAGLSPYYEDGAKKECGIIAVISRSCCLSVIKSMQEEGALFDTGGDCPDGYMGLGVTCGPFAPSGCYKTRSNLIKPVIQTSNDFTNSGISYTPGNESEENAKNTIDDIDKQVFAEAGSRLDADLSFNNEAGFMWVEENGENIKITKGRFLEFDSRQRKKDEVFKYFAENSFVFNEKSSTKNTSAFGKNNIACLVHYNLLGIKKIECGDIE